MARKKQQISTAGGETVSNWSEEAVGISPRPAADVVIPLVKVEGEKHLLAEIFEEDELPLLKAVGFAQLAPGNAWVSYVMTTQGDKVISIQVSEPNLRQIAEEAAKTDFVTEFMDKGL